MGQLCIKMDKDSVMRNNTTTNNNNNIRGGGEATSSFLRPSIDSSRQQATTSSDFGFQWGNRKRLRCMKIQVKDKDKDHDSTGPVHRTTVRVDRRVVRADKDSSNSHPSNNGYLNLRHRPSSSPPPPPQRILRYTHFDLKSRVSLIFMLWYGACGTRYAEFGNFGCVAGFLCVLRWLVMWLIGLSLTSR